LLKRPKGFGAQMGGQDPPIMRALRICERQRVVGLAMKLVGGCGDDLGHSKAGPRGERPCWFGLGVAAA